MPASSLEERLEHGAKIVFDPIRRQALDTPARVAGEGGRLSITGEHCG